MKRGSSNTLLLDVNVLLAIAWPNHQFFPTARKRLESHRGRWATCALTELGFIRLSAQPASRRPAQDSRRCRRPSSCDDRRPEACLHRSYAVACGGHPVSFFQQYPWAPPGNGPLPTLVGGTQSCQTCNLRLANSRIGRGQRPRRGVKRSTLARGFRRVKSARNPGQAGKNPRRVSPLPATRHGEVFRKRKLSLRRAKPHPASSAGVGESFRPAHVFNFRDSCDRRKLSLFALWVIW